MLFKNHFCCAPSLVTLSCVSLVAWCRVGCVPTTQFVLGGARVAKFGLKPFPFGQIEFCALCQSKSNGWHQAPALYRPAFFTSGLVAGAVRLFVSRPLGGWFLVVVVVVVVVVIVAQMESE